MKEDIEKLIWVCIMFILILLSLKWDVFILLTMPYCLYMGACFRGKNWFLGWKKVSEINERIRKRT